MPSRSTCRAFLGLLILLCACGSGAAGAGPGVSSRLRELLADVPADRVPSGVLRDRVLSLAPIDAFDGAQEAPAATPSDWRQIYDEIHRSSLEEPSWRSLAEIEGEAKVAAREGVRVLAVLDFRYDRIRRDALETGALVVRDGRLVLGEGAESGVGGGPRGEAGPDDGEEAVGAAKARGAFEERRVTAAAVFPGHTGRGEATTFRIPDPARFSNVPTPITGVDVDFGDGRGYVRVSPGSEPTIRYDQPGEKILRTRLAYADGTVRHASTRFEVRALRTPSPNDTLHLTATIPYQGLFGQGDAYVYWAAGHTTLTEPAVVLEGFDYDNTMNWDELYALLNRENLLEELRAQGFDVVVLNFRDAVDSIQRNAMVAVELLQQVQATIEPDRTIALAGASMGGLIGRYALAYMETNGLPHRVRTFLSFDSPQNGANIPLGIQYWLWFFQDESPDAAALLAALDTPGARQMLAYHHTDPPGGTGQADPLRAQLLADFAAVGAYPEQPRTVAIANGSGARLHQGFAPGEQIIRWEYSSFLVDIIGNVWAVPDATSRTIFRGVIDILGPWYEESVVTVSGTRPYDNAPGGWRDSMAQMDATPAPYGDIIALHPNHAFIPTVSALALDTNDLFYDVAGDPDILTHTPFDAVYFPTGGENQEHVAITPENKPWILAEIVAGAAGVEAPAGALTATARIREVWPNPIGAAARIRCDLPRPGRAELTVHDAAGRRVAVVASPVGSDRFPAGDAAVEVAWNGRDDAGRRLPPGVYFLRLTGDGYAAAEKIVVR